MNIICLGGRVMGAMVAWDLVETFLQAEFSTAERHLRQLSKVAALEKKTAQEFEVALQQVRRRPSNHALQYLSGRQS